MIFQLLQSPTPQNSAHRMTQPWQHLGRTRMRQFWYDNYQNKQNFIINITMSQEVKIEEVELREAEVRTENKNIVFCWFLILTELFYCFMYGFYIRLNQSTITSSQEFVHTALLLLLVIVGFGLAFARPYKLIWTSIGFNLLITVLSVQTFFLVHAFWVKAGIYNAGSTFSGDIYTIALVPGETGSVITGANFNEAIKCSLACIVAFNFIKGRAGLLELYVVTIFGTVVYQLARQTSLNNFPYEIGTIKIFLYGGTLGLFISLVFTKLRRQTLLLDHPNNYENRLGITLTLLGTLICWAFFPLLTRDAYIVDNLNTHEVRVFSLVLAMSSAAVLSIFIGYFRYGFKLVIFSVIGAGVSVLSSTAYMSNPVYAIVFGLTSALVQLGFMALHDHFKVVVDPNAFVFVGQGFLGVFFLTISRRTVQASSNLLTFVLNSAKRAEYVLGNSAITIGMALLLGFTIGSLITCCVYQDEVDKYNDFTYWVESDGVSAQSRVVKRYQDNEYNSYADIQKNASV